LAIITGIQVKTTMRYHFKDTMKAIIKTKHKIASITKKVEKLELLCIIKACTIVKKTMESPQKI
jgi:hypothetical protein